MIEPSLTDDAFLGGALRVLQPVEGYRAGLDAVLLAAAAKARIGRNSLVLDAGAGVGVVGLCIACSAMDAEVVLVEREPELADLARRNCERNNLARRVRVVVADVGAGGRALHGAEEQSGLVAGGFDHVVANPPYYTDSAGTPPRDRTRAVSHQMPARDLDRWMAFIVTAARTGGRVTLIHRADALGEVLAALFGRFGGIEVTPVHPRATEPASRILVSAIKASKAPLVIRPALVVHDAEGRYLPEVEAVLRRGAALQCNQS